MIQIENPTLIAGLSGDLSASFNSNPMFVGDRTAYAIQAVWTGSGALGTFKLQVSNDPTQPQGQAGASQVTHWSDYTDSALAVTGAGDHMFDIWATEVEWVRLVWTPASTASTGTLTVCNLNGKG